MFFWTGKRFGLSDMQIEVLLDAPKDGGVINASLMTEKSLVRKGLAKYAPEYTGAQRKTIERRVKALASQALRNMKAGKCWKAYVTARDFSDEMSLLSETRAMLTKKGEEMAAALEKMRAGY